MNTVHISGNIGIEPEFKVFGSGKRKVTFSVALNQFGKSGEQVDTIWVPCQAWDTVYDRLFKCQQKAKLSGRKIHITGALAQTKWTDQVTGKNHTKLLIKVQTFELLISAHQEPVTSVQASSTDVQTLFDGKPVSDGYIRRMPFPGKPGWPGVPRDDKSAT